MNPDRSLTDPADRAEICEVLARYARAVDRLDLELLRACYHPDAHEDRGRYAGGLDGFVEWIERTLRPMEATWHLVGLPLIETRGVDAAHVESYCLGIQYLHGETEGALRVNQVPCRYVDRFERRAGRWRIASRVAVYEPTIPLGQTTAVSLGAVSRRDHADPAFAED
jgi:hypothetical protein